MYDDESKRSLIEIDENANHRGLNRHRRNLNTKHEWIWFIAVLICFTIIVVLLSKISANRNSKQTNDLDDYYGEPSDTDIQEYESNEDNEEDYYYDDLFGLDGKNNGEEGGDGDDDDDDDEKGNAEAASKFEEQENEKEAEAEAEAEEKEEEAEEEEDAIDQLINGNKEQVPAPAQEDSNKVDNKPAESQQPEAPKQDTNNNVKAPLRKKRITNTQFDTVMAIVFSKVAEMVDTYRANGFQSVAQSAKYLVGSLKSRRFDAIAIKNTGTALTGIAYTVTTEKCTKTDTSFYCTYCTVQVPVPDNCPGDNCPNCMVRQQRTIGPSSVNDSR